MKIVTQTFREPADSPKTQCWLLPLRFRLLLAFTKLCSSAEEARELARQQLKLLLKAGYSPLRFYLHDIKKYFYLGELLAVVDLSLVRFRRLPST